MNILITSDRDFKSVLNFDGSLRRIKDIYIHSEKGIIVFRLSHGQGQEVYKSEAFMKIEDKFFEITMSDLVKSAKFYGFLERVPVSIVERHLND